MPSNSNSTAGQGVKNFVNGRMPGLFGTKFSYKPQAHTSSSSSTTNAPRPSIDSTAAAPGGSAFGTRANRQFLFPQPQGGSGSGGGTVVTSKQQAPDASDANPLRVKLEKVDEVMGRDTEHAGDSESDEATVKMEMDKGEAEVTIKQEKIEKVQGHTVNHNHPTSSSGTLNSSDFDTYLDDSTTLAATTMQARSYLAPSTIAKVKTEYGVPLNPTTTTTTTFGTQGQGQGDENLDMEFDEDSEFDEAEFDKQVEAMIPGPPMPLGAGADAGAGTNEKDGGWTDEELGGSEGVTPGEKFAGGEGMGMGMYAGSTHVEPLNVSGGGGGSERGLPAMAGPGHQQPQPHERMESMSMAMEQGPGQGQAQSVPMGGYHGHQHQHQHHQQSQQFAHAQSSVPAPAPPTTQHHRTPSSKPLQPTYATATTLPNPPLLPTDFTPTEISFSSASMTLEEWEAAGLAIAQRAYTFIQKIIAHRRSKAALFEAVERVADERAAMLEEREEELKEKAREVRRRGRSLLEDSF